LVLDIKVLVLVLDKQVLNPSLLIIANLDCVNNETSHSACRFGIVHHFPVI